jgi:glycosyltransferase involved in cell wall biosynthesis
MHHGRSDELVNALGAHAAHHPSALGRGRVRAAAPTAMRMETEVPATFVMPLYADRPQSGRWLDEAVGALLAQTDPNWRLVVVDDLSPDVGARERMLAIGREHADRVTVLPQQRHRGAGPCRNIGVAWASEHGSPLVLFNDADDVSHPRRLDAVKALLGKRPGAGFVYSRVRVVDERGLPLARERLVPALQEILESHDGVPVEGADGWIRMGTETGYTCVTSTVAVRTDVAVAHPFPDVPFSEDAHTWLRMAAHAEMAYAEGIPTRYRVPQDVRAQSSRDRVGTSCDEIKARVDTAGFAAAMRLAMHRGRIARDDSPILWERFFLRLAQTMRRGGQRDLASSLVERARLARAGARGHRLS